MSLSFHSNTPHQHTKPVKEEILEYFQQHCDPDGVVDFSNRRNTERRSG